MACCFFIFKTIFSRWPPCFLVSPSFVVPRFQITAGESCEYTETYRYQFLQPSAHLIWGAISDLCAKSDVDSIQPDKFTDVAFFRVSSDIRQEIVVMCCANGVFFFFNAEFVSAKSVLRVLIVLAGYRVVYGVDDYFSAFRMSGRTVYDTVT